MGFPPLVTQSDFLTLKFSIDKVYKIYAMKVNTFLCYFIFFYPGDKLILASIIRMRWQIFEYIDLSPKYSTS